MSKHYNGQKIKELIAGADLNGGSKEVIIDAVKQWDEEAKTVVITETGEIIINSTKLNDEETESWFFWTQGGFKNRQGN